MIDYQTFSQIKQYQQAGLNAGQIANKLSLDSRTVSYWLGEERYRQRKGVQSKSKLDPYKDFIVGAVEKYPFTAIQLYQRIVDDGYSGSYTLVKDYVRKVRPKRKPAFLTLAFAPGDYAQMDWGVYKTVRVGNDTRRKLNFFVMVLCYSRMMYVQFSLSQSMEHFLDCHQQAFRYFGRVPRHIMIDNLKTGVLKRSRFSREITFNPRYLDFANHYGFTIKPCGIAKGNEKGRVENAVGYVKKNFLSGLDITHFDVLNPAIARWMDEIANVRIHGELKKKPTELLSEDLAAMLDLNTNNYDIARIESTRATKLFRVTLDTNRYSVPAEYAGQPVTLKIYPQRLCIYHQDKLIARHQRSYLRQQDIENPDHPKALLAQRRKAQEQKLLQQFIALSTKSSDYYRQLAARRFNVMVHVRKIVALIEIYGKEATARALEDALHYQAFSSEYITNLLEQQKNTLSEPATLHLTRREDLLNITLKEADLSPYTDQQSKGKNNDKRH